MNVTMQIAANQTGVYVHDTGHTYDLQGLDRIIEQLRVARRWYQKDRALRGLETKGAK